MQPNAVQLLNACNSKYIALCEGDDYWTDSLKLQKQVDFLEANSDFAICFHRVETLKEETNEKFVLADTDLKEVSTFDDLALRNYISTLSCIFRNKLFGEFPNWFSSSPLGDYPLHLLNAQYGKIKFFNDVMGVYRVHGGGAWSLKKQEYQYKSWLTVLELCYNYFYPRSSNNFERQIALTLSELCFLYFNENDYAEFRFYFNKLVKWKKYPESRTLIALTTRFLVSQKPSLARLYKFLVKQR